MTVNREGVGQESVKGVLAVVAEVVDALDYKRRLFEITVVDFDILDAECKIFAEKCQCWLIGGSELTDRCKQYSTDSEQEYKSWK